MYICIINHAHVWKIHGMWLAPIFPMKVKLLVSCGICQHYLVDSRYSYCGCKGGCKGKVYACSTKFEPLRRFLFMKEFTACSRLLRSPHMHSRLREYRMPRLVSSSEPSWNQGGGEWGCGEEGGGGGGGRRVVVVGWWGRWVVLCGPYWGCAAPKGHFLSPDSLAKGVFLAQIP